MKKRSYEEMTHIYGRIWILSALGMIFSYPIITCIYYGAWPGWKPVLLRGHEGSVQHPEYFEGYQPCGSP